jgi:citrate lyase subunit beta/citryl-CoA lyase
MTPPALARSLLFVPGDRPDRFDKALAAGADATILDLEDGVDPASRDAARGHVRDQLSADGQAMVRLSTAKGDDLAADLRAIADRPGLSGVLVPKAEDADIVNALVRALPRSTPVLLLVETAAGLLAAPTLARVPGVTRLVLGAVDLEADTGISQDADVLRSIRVGLTLASRAAGLAGPVDGVCTELADPSVTEIAAREAVRTGFTGKLCIHPRQVAGVNAVFSPSPDAVAWARQVVEAAGAHGYGAFRLDGQMVDAPVIHRATAVLAASGTFSARAASHHQEEHR